MKYTIGQAAIATGKAKSTIHAAIKNGIISASKNELKQFEIDPAELHRVYPPIKVESNTERGRTAENDVLYAQIKALETQIQLKDEIIDGLKSERDTLKRFLPQPNAVERAVEAVEVIKNEIEVKEEKPQGLWARLFG